MAALCFGLLLLSYHLLITQVVLNKRFLDFQPFLNNMLSALQYLWGDVQIHRPLVTYDDDRTKNQLHGTSKVEEEVEHSFALMVIPPKELPPDHTFEIPVTAVASVVIFTLLLLILRALFSAKSKKYLHKQKLLTKKIEELLEEKTSTVLMVTDLLEKIKQQEKQLRDKQEVLYKAQHSNKDLKDSLKDVEKQMEEMMAEMDTLAAKFANQKEEQEREMKAIENQIDTMMAELQ